LGCLYCGKEIGPIRHLRDREFCTDAHRISYHERLGKALFRMSRPDPAPAPPSQFFPSWPVQTGRTFPSLTDWVRPAGARLRPISTEFPFSFAPIQAGQPATYSALAAGALPAFDVLPISDPQPFDFNRRGPDSERAWLAPLSEALDAILPLRAPLLPLASVSIVLASSDLAAKLIPIAAAPISHRPVMPRLAGALERAPEPRLAVAAPVEFEHAVEERLVEPAIAGCARRSNAPRLPGVAPAIAAPALEWPGFRAALQPSAAAQTARARAPLEAALYPERGTSLPAFRVETRDDDAEDAALLERIPPPGRNLLAFPGAQAAERWLAVRGTAEAALPVVARATLLPALELESVDRIPALRDRAGWLAPLAPEPVAVEVHALTELRHLAPPTPVLSLPKTAIAACTVTQMPGFASWQAMEEAEAVEMLLQPAMAEALPAQPALTLPPLAWFDRAIAGEVAPRAADGVWVALPAAEPCWEAVTAEAVESLAAASATAELRWQPETQLPSFAVRPAALRPMAGFGANGPAAFQPQADEAFQPPLEPAATLAVTAPDSGLAPRRPALAAALPIPLEFFFRAPMGALRKRISWIPTAPEPMLPAWNLQPAAERLRGAREPGRNRQSDLAAVFKMPEARQRKVRPIAADALKALAASLLVGSLLWYGVPQIRQARHQVLINHSGSSITAEGGTGAEDGEALPRAGGDSGRMSGSGSASAGLMGRIRGAMASRAATEITDSFHGGMSAWGAGAKALAPGWSRSSGGFVRPGQLALLSPSLGFADYRLEFLGEIENKSMDWVVRAADSKNYYAMKFTVIAAGPRPVIAMVHYPVQGGKAGHRVEIPLNVMVHNHTPYRVSVEVSGNRIVTSIEGEEVDSWTDTALPKGGVGFFADAGERARLYWVKVAHNDDWIGRICAYFSSDGGSATAELLPSSAPPAERQRGSGGGDEPVLAAALAFQRRKRFPFSRIGEPQYFGPQHQDHRRFSLCHPS
jgi:hypothetical protein